jgi:hypothetical protein
VGFAGSTRKGPPMTDTDVQQVRVAERRIRRLDGLEPRWAQDRVRT